MDNELIKRLKAADKAMNRYLKAKHPTTKQAAQVRCKYLDVCIDALTTVAGELVVSGEGDELLRIVQDTIDMVSDTQDFLSDTAESLERVQSALND